jgi:hypothetical protein
MAKVQILYWQEIPSVVEARDEGGVAKQQLSDKFQQLIDHAAMIRKLAGTDGYLEQWNKGKPTERPGDAKSVAAAVAAEIETRFNDIRSDVIAKSRAEQNEGGSLPKAT